MITDQQDAFGHGIYDYFQAEKGHRHIYEIEEREDGYIDTSGGPAVYFWEYRQWPLCEKKALRYVQGRVLDIGCGAGRHALYLQEKGMDVLGIDNSPLAIKVCKERGLRNAEVLSINQINRGLGVFDTILMLGNNFGLFGSFESAKRLLTKLSRITTDNSRIIAASNDIYKTKNPEHLNYHKYNRKRGRMAGQIRLRVRYQKYTTPYFDYLMVSKSEMENILDGTDWQANKFIDSQGPVYVAIIDKRKR
jgi:SAM-dependent methyltransferase